MDINVNVRFSASKELENVIIGVAAAMAAAIRPEVMDPLPWEAKAKKEEGAGRGETTPNDDGSCDPVARHGETEVEAKAENTKVEESELPFEEMYPKDGAPVKKEDQKEEPKPEAKEEPEASPAKKVSKMEIRAAIHEVRNRVEYPDGPDGEEDVKRHKQATAIFKDLANRIGGKKPTELEGTEAEEFIEACKGIDVVDGNVVPFKD